MGKALSFIRKRRGQGLVEYGLILVLVAVICIMALSSIYGKTSSPMGNVANSFP